MYAIQIKEYTRQNGEKMQLQPELHDCFVEANHQTIRSIVVQIVSIFNLDPDRFPSACNWCRSQNLWFILGVSSLYRIMNTRHFQKRWDYPIISASSRYKTGVPAPFQLGILCNWGNGHGSNVVGSSLRRSRSYYRSDGETGILII